MKENRMLNLAANISMAVGTILFIYATVSDGVNPMLSNLGLLLFALGFGWAMYQQQRKRSQRR